VLGGSPQLADPLLPFGREWHDRIARDPVYHLTSCEAPG